MPVMDGGMTERAVDRGLLFVLDGPEGAGKSSQIEPLLQYLAGRGRIAVTFRDPGTTAAGEAIRAILLDRATGELAPLTELLLFMAARAQLLDEKVRPALAAGTCVVLDRYYYATIAYQIHGFGADRLPPEATEWVRAAAGGNDPDLAWLLDVPPEVGIARLTGDADRIEQRDVAFHRRVREGFRRQAAADAERVRLIDAMRSPDEVFAEIRSTLDARLAEIDA
jgi:dTMP kinase